MTPEIDGHTGDDQRLARTTVGPARQELRSAWQREMEKAMKETWFHHGALPVPENAVPKLAAPQTPAPNADSPQVPVPHMTVRDAPTVSSHRLSPHSVTAAPGSQGVRARHGAVGDQSCPEVAARHAGPPWSARAAAIVPPTQAFARLTGTFVADRGRIKVPEDAVQGLRAATKVDESAGLVAAAASRPVMFQPRPPEVVEAAGSVGAFQGRDAGTGMNLSRDLAPPSQAIASSLMPISPADEAQPGRAAATAMPHSSGAGRAQAAARPEGMRAPGKPPALPLIGAEKEGPPLRLHTERSEHGVRVWLGADIRAESAIPGIVQHLVRWYGGNGIPVLSIVLNGRELHGPEAAGCAEGPAGFQTDHDRPVQRKAAGKAASPITRRA